MLCVSHVLFRVLELIYVVVIVLLLALAKFTATSTGPLSNGEQGNLLALHSVILNLSNVSVQNSGTTECNIEHSCHVHCWLLCVSSFFGVGGLC